MDCPVICVQHEEEGTKCLMVESPPGAPGLKVMRLSLLTATKLMKELISPQRDGGWARIPVKN